LLTNGAKQQQAPAFPKSLGKKMKRGRTTAGMKAAFSLPAAKCDSAKM